MLTGSFLANGDRDLGRKGKLCGEFQKKYGEGVGGWELGGVPTA